MTARSPADVIQGALRVQDVPHPDIATQAVLAALTGHGYTIKLKTQNTPTQRCGRPLPEGHPGTALEGGRCPTCRWTPGDEK